MCASVNLHGCLCLCVHQLTTCKKIRRIKCEDVALITSDGRKLEGLWTSRHFESSGPTTLDSGERSAVILFHANAQIGSDLYPFELPMFIHANAHIHQNVFSHQL
jgi:hypothetical protein